MVDQKGKRLSLDDITRLLIENSFSLVINNTTRLNKHPHLKALQPQPLCLLEVILSIHLLCTLAYFFNLVRQISGEI